MSEQTLTNTVSTPTFSAGDKDQVFNAIRTLNREGKPWDMAEANMLANHYLMPPAQVYDWGIRLYQHFILEHGASNGTIVQKIEVFLSDRFTFRRNDITRKVMMHTKGSLIEEPCRYNDIWRLVQHHLKDFGKGAKFSLSDIQNLLESDYVKNFNPIKEYFEKLPEWDEKDHIHALASHVICSDQRFWLDQFKKCLVRMIACSYGGQENRIVMTLFTPSQNIGKNRLIKFLVPPLILDYYKEDPVTSHKDSEIALTENFLWHFDELEALNRKELTSLKSFISRSSSKQRRAYARQEETRARIVNFWGSTNKDEFLADVENTRWLCFRVTKINWDYNNDETDVRNIDINKVWSQAWHLYKTGFNYRLDSIERGLQATTNSSFEAMGVEKQLLVKYIQPGIPLSAASDFMIIVELLQYLQLQTNFKVQISSYAIGTAMNQLGYVAVTRELNGKKVKGYWVIKQAIMNGHQLSLGATDEPKLVNDDSELPF